MGSEVGVVAVLALAAGWTVTEVGRRPWAMFGVLRTTMRSTRPHGGDSYWLLAPSLWWLYRIFQRFGLE